METIEGYRFAIDLEDRGMGRSLRTLSKEATTLKRIMRADFNEAESLGNGFGALQGRVTNLNRVIGSYNNAIQEAQRQIASTREGVDAAKQKYEEQAKAIGDVNKASDEEKAKLQSLKDEYEDNQGHLLKLINREQNLRNQRARANTQLTEAEQRLRMYNGVLESTRSITAGMAAGVSNYNRLLEQQGMKAYATKGRLSMLNEQHKLSSQQLGLETSRTRQLQTTLSSLQSTYSRNSVELNKRNAELGQIKAKLDQEKASSSADADAIKKLSDRYANLSSKQKELKNTQSGLASRIGTTTNELQQQTARTTKAASETLRLKTAINSVGTGWLGSVARAMTNIDVKVRAATSHTRAWANELKGSLMTVGVGVAAFGAGIGKSVQMSSQLQQSWVVTKNLLQTGAGSVKEAREEVSRMGVMQRDAAKYSKEYGFSQKEIADQYTELVKRGYSANQSIGSMKSMLQAARASGDDFNDVVKNVSSTVDAFGMRTNNTARMIQRTERVTNAMAYAADMTATDFKGMGEAMSYVSASAHQAGQSVEVTTAAVGELSNAGIEGTRAGTGMRKMMNSLLAPTAAAQSALKKYGMSIDDFKTKSGALKQLPDIMKEINKHTKNLGKADRGAFFKAVFGTTGQQAAMVLSQNADAMEKLVQKEKEAEKNNYVQRLAQKNMASTKMQMKQLQMQVQAFAIQIGSSLLPAVNKVAQAISKWSESSQGKATLKDFSDSIKGVGNTIARNAGSIISFLGGFASGLLDVAKGVNILITPLKWLFSGISKLTGHSGNLSHFFGVVTGGIVGVIGVLKILHTTISGVNAVRSDLKSIGVMKDTTTQIKEQDTLYQRMIELQERSLALAQDQAKTQTGNTATLENSVGEGTTSTTTANVAATTVKDTEAGMVNAGEKAGTGFLTGFLSKASRLNRLLLGLVMPTGMLDAGAKIGSKLLAGISTSFRFAGRLILKPFLAIGSLGKTIGSKFVSLFVSQGSKLSNIFKVLKNSKFGTIVSRWAIPETFKKAGVKSAEAFRASFSKLRVVVHPSQWFKSVEPAAKTAGEKAGGSLVKGVGETATKSGLLGTIGKTIAKGIADPLMIGLGAIDIMRAWNTSKHKTRAKNVGGAIGNLVGSIAGMKAGASLGAKLGTVGGPIGMAAGALIGGVLGNAIGKAAGPSFAKFGHGIAKTVDLIFKKHDWKAAFGNLGKSWKQFWHGMGNWWDQVIGKKTKKSSNEKSENTEHRYKGTKVKYSKSDVATLKAMSKAVDEYKASLKGLKSVVKNNDPTKEMNRMLSKLKGSVKGWSSLAKPIKKIGDAFKTLSTFSRSMAKRDAFKALNNDLPKLDSTLKKHGEDIKKRLENLGKAFSSKKLSTPLKKLTKQLSDSIKTWKKFDQPIKQLAKSFKTLQSATRTMSGKNGLESLKRGFADLDNALSKQKIGKNLKSIATEISKSGVAKKLSSMNSTVKNSAKNWKNLASPMNKAANSFKTVAKAVDTLNGIGVGKKGKSKGSQAGLEGVATSVKDLYNAVKRYPFGRMIEQQANLAVNAMNGHSKKGGLATHFVEMTNSMTNSLRRFGKSFKSEWEKPWENLDRPVSRGMGEAYSTLEHRLSEIQGKRSSFSASFLKGWHSWIDSVVSSFRRGFNKLPGIAESAMKGIISRLNKGISGVNKVIGDFGGDKKLSVISYATGTRGGHPGGHMLVNDSQGPHWKELVKFPGKAWRMFEGRNVLIPNAPKGTQVINGEQTYALNSRGLLPALGVHAYADGTDDGDEEADKIVKNPFGELKKIFFGSTSFNGSPIIADLGSAMAVGLIKSVQDIIKKMAEEADDNGKAATPAMIRKAAARMGIHDLPDSFVSLLMGVIMTESGNRSIRQSAGVQDVNARSGDWAAGILQYTNQTFMHYAMPGHTNRYKPYDELLAFFNNSDWRNSIGYPGYAHGKPDWLHSGPQGTPRLSHFEDGGLVRRQMIAEMGENNRPEMIIPLDINKRPRALSLIDSTLDHMEQDGGGTGGLHSRNSGANEQTNGYLKQVVAILGQIAGLNAQQIQAILSMNLGSDLKSRRARSQFYRDYGNDQRISDYQAF